jgi:mono/diheme cytochrome c family protein
LSRHESGPASGLAMVALLALAGGCTPMDNALAAVPVFSFLRESPAFDPYEAPRPAPPGSVPFSSPAGAYEPAIQPTQAGLMAFAATPYGRNPLPPGDAASLELGRAMYERYCTVCHSANGAGNGPVVGPGKVPLGPAINSGAAVTHPDGYLYAIIKAGRTFMPPYGARTTDRERWAIVNYLRQLQGATGGPAAAQPAPGTAGIDTTATTAGTDTARE